jgi:L-aspartate oxidase
VSNLKSDVLIIGTGIGGLYTAMNLYKDSNILMVTNSKIRDCNSYLAQGGITTIKAGDEASFTEDTLIAGHRENSLEAIDVVSKESWENIEALINMGADFQKDEFGELKFTKEAAHSKHRILYNGSETGKMLVETLIENIKNRDNVTILEDTELLDLKVSGNCVYGGNFKNGSGKFSIDAKVVVLATGGIGGLFKSSTNQPNIKGIGLALAEKHHILTKDIQYIQHHPTALEDIKGNKLFLLSEALRGEGAVIRDANGERFVDELLPRDKVAEAIVNKKRESGKSVYLDITSLDSEYTKVRFSGIYNECLERGFDITRDLLPINPAQHYFMGGIKVDMAGRSSCENLYVVGEAACTGLHGKNRLASNSLLEAVVFGRRVALDINSIIGEIEFSEKIISEISGDLKDLAKKSIIRYREDLRNELHHN